METLDFHEEFINLEMEDKVSGNLYFNLRAFSYDNRGDVRFVRASKFLK